MAKIHVETAVFKLSKLVRDDEPDQPSHSLLDSELHEQIVNLIEEHLGPTVLVETEKK